MNKTFFPKLAATNIKKNSKTYFPYILTCIGTVMMYYIMASLSKNKDILKMSESLISMLTMGSFVIAIFSGIFLFYTNSFLIKRRKKEFGLLNILGMEKKHISRVVLWETIYTSGASNIVGLLGGMLLSKLMMLLLYKLLSLKVPLGFEISGEAILYTVVLFVVIFGLTFLNTLRQIHLSKPIELLHGGQTGEREPKTKWILAILGITCLGIGYYMALTTKNPLQALTSFFIAVVLVIVGTYCLFTAGSIAILKILRKRKGYYYKTSHFISVSGMMYRMKQNAVGLANICILAAAVLVMLSTTISLYIGVEDVIQTRFPRNMISTTYDISNKGVEKVRNQIGNILKSHDLTAEKIIDYRYISFAAEQKDNEFIINKNEFKSDNVKSLSFVPLSDYNRMMNRSVSLNKDEILIFSNNDAYQKKNLSVLGRTFNVKEELDAFSGDETNSTQVYYSSYYIIVKDIDIVNEIAKKQKPADGNGSYSLPVYYFGFNLNTSDIENVQIYKEINLAIKSDSSFKSDRSIAGQLESSVVAHESFYTIYGGLFFLGIFLGLLFIMATVLIIYYKQISEGYDDKERFVIMQKVGMSKSEIKRSIRSQILTVFFLPLIAAGIHIAFAFPVITKLLALFNLTNVSLFAWCTVGTMLVFAGFYAIVYALTAKVYYKIVS